MNNKDFYLKYGIQKLNLSMKQIADDMDVSQSYISAILSGKKKIGGKTAMALSDLYGFDLNWLLTGDGEMMKDDKKGDILNKKVTLTNEKEVPFDELPMNKQMSSLYTLLTKQNDRFENIEKKISELEDEYSNIIDLIDTNSSVIIKGQELQEKDNNILLRHIATQGEVLESIKNIVAKMDSKISV